MEISEHPPAVRDFGGTLTVRNETGEEVLAALYLLLLDAELLHIVFYEGIPKLSRFLSWLDRPESRYLVAFFRPHPTLDVPNPQEEIAGMGWLWNIQGIPRCRRADTGMVFLPKFQGKGMPVEWTRQMLDYSFGEVDLDVLYGLTPYLNKAALAFSRRMGFRQTEPLPKYGICNGLPSDLVISYMTRGDWWEIRKSKRFAA